MRYGRLNRKITIQRKTANLDDAGDPVETWATLSTRWASVNPVSGDEAFSTPEIMAKQQVEFQVRWSDVVANVSPLDRIIYPALTTAPRGIYDILAVHEIGRREGLRIVAWRMADLEAEEPLPEWPLDYAGVTGAWSFSRARASFGSNAVYTATAGLIASANDQSGSARNLTQDLPTARPALSEAGANDRACAVFDGTDDVLISSVAMSSFITGSAGYVVVSAIVDAIASDSASTFTNDALFSDSSGFVGLHLRSTGPVVQAYNWDGGDDHADASITIGQEVVVEWRHDAGDIMCRVNGGTWQSVASGDTTNITGALRMARGSTNVTACKIFEMATFNVVPSETDRDALAAEMLAWIS